MLKNQTPSKGELSTSWWRCTRVLFEEGRPLQPHAMLLAEPTAKGSAAFGVIGKTRLMKSDRHRLIFWPPMPKGMPEPTPEHPHRITDHITLDLWSGKSHPTWYKFNGKSESPKEAPGWKLNPVEGQGLSHWFTMMVKHSVLDEQDFEVEANVHVPGSDGPRRIEEFVKHANRSALSLVQLPPLPQAGNYVCCNFFVVTDREKPKDYSKIVQFVGGLPIWDVVTPDESCEKSQLTRGSSVVVDGTEVIIVTVCPGGTIKEPLEFAMSAAKGS